METRNSGPWQNRRKSSRWWKSENLSVKWIDICYITITIKSHNFVYFLCRQIISSPSFPYINQARPQPKLFCHPRSSAEDSDKDNQPSPCSRQQQQQVCILYMLIFIFKSHYFSGWLLLGMTKTWGSTWITHSFSSPSRTISS